uniref:Uncharacterized protein n=1 Tax=Phaeomonas parva TaxID=124430 RepID=A0A7S1XQ67_9STRA|mmetsp:Transcript_23692/g.74546  ORF Transcript_23692/g.74546 Transcript_23692/m.74546 type:complete len:290 (+) Transcript_23692:299-1168(+)
MSRSVAESTVVKGEENNTEEISTARAVVAPARAGALETPAGGKPMPKGVSTNGEGPASSAAPSVATKAGAGGGNARASPRTARQRREARAAEMGTDTSGTSLFDSEKHINSFEKQSSEELPIFVYADALAQAGNDAEFVSELLWKGLEEVGHSTASLRKVFEGDKLPLASEVRRLAQSVEGLSSCFAFYRMSAMAQILERRAQAHEEGVFFVPERPKKRKRDELPITRQAFYELRRNFQRLSEAHDATKAYLATHGFDVNAEAAVTAGSPSRQAERAAEDSPSRREQKA